MKHHGHSMAWIMIIACFLTAGLIGLAALVLAKPQDPIETQNVLVMVGLPFAILMAVAMLVMYVVLQFVLGSIDR